MVAAKKQKLCIGNATKNLISGFIHSPDESIYLNLLSEPQKGRRKVVTIPIPLLLRILG